MYWPVSAAGSLVDAMFPLAPEDQTLVIKALACSGVTDLRPMLTAFFERMPTRRKHVDKFLLGKEPLLDALPLPSGLAAIDALWGGP